MVCGEIWLVKENTGLMGMASHPQPPLAGGVAYHGSQVTTSSIHPKLLHWILLALEFLLLLLIHIFSQNYASYFLAERMLHRRLITRVYSMFVNSACLALSDFSFIKCLRSGDGRFQNHNFFKLTYAEQEKGSSCMSLSMSLICLHFKIIQFLTLENRRKYHVHVPLALTRGKTK